MHRRFVEERDAPFGVRGIDGNAQRLDQLAVALFALGDDAGGADALGDILEGVHRTDDLARIVEQRIDVHRDDGAAPVGALDHHLTFARGRAGAQCFRHGRLFVREKLSVRVPEPERSAEPLVRFHAKCGHATPELDCTLVAVRDNALAVAGVHGDGQQIGKRGK